MVLLVDDVERVLIDDLRGGGIGGGGEGKSKVGEGDDPEVGLGVRLVRDGGGGGRKSVISDRSSSTDGSFVDVGEMIGGGGGG